MQRLPNQWIIAYLLGMIVTCYEYSGIKQLLDVQYFMPSSESIIHTDKARPDIF